MNMILDINHFNIENVQFLDKKHNIIIEGDFTKIIYSDSHLTMSGIYIYFPLFIKYIKNNIAYFNYNDNRSTIDKLVAIESNILVEYLNNKNRSNKFVYAQKKQSIVNAPDLRSDGKVNRTFTTLGKEKTLECKILFTELKSGTMKVNTSYDAIPKIYGFVVKLSGVWENQITIGITHKSREVRVA